MGVQSTGFQSAGQRTEHLIPGAFSRSNFVRDAGGGASANRAVLIGESRGGTPNVLTFYASPSEARDALVSGPLLDSVLAAFSPGNDLIPQRIGAMRVNPGLQASRTLLNSATPMLLVKSAFYGLFANQLKMKLEAGTTGRKITIGWKGLEYVTDNIIRSSIQVQYVGSAASATLTVTKAKITTACASTAADDLDISFSTYSTLQDLVDYINDHEKYTCVLVGPSGSQPSTQLDSMSATDVKTNPLTLTSNLQALIDVLNASPFIDTASFITDAATRALPTNDSGYIYFSGGTHGAITASEYAATLTALEAEDVSIIGTSSTEEAIHVLIKNHCVLMSSTNGRKERTCVVGGPTGESVAQAAARSVVLNSKYATVAYPGYTHYDNDDASKTKLYSPAMYAAKLVGMESVLAINEPWTNKSVDVLAWEAALTTGQIETLILAGVTVGGKSQDGRLATIRALTTYQGTELQLCERSMVREDLYMAKDLRNALAGGIGSVNGLSDGTIRTTFAIKVAKWLAEGLIVKGSSGLAAWGLVIQRIGDAAYLEYHTYLTAPTNFMFVTANQHVYSGSVTAVTV